jgi:hypothetical protein
MLAGTGKVLMGVFVRFRAMLVSRTDRDLRRLGTAQRSDRRGHRNEPQQQPGRQEAAGSAGAAKCVHGGWICRCRV